MVKGTSRRVVVVDSPDPHIFEQAIFIVRNDAFRKEGVTPEQVVNEACRVARLGLEKCKEDLTDCFICLLLQAREDRDEEQFKKLYASAKRRKMSDIQRVNAAIGPYH